MKSQTTKAAAKTEANLTAVMNLIAVPDDGKLMAIEDRRTTPPVEVQVIPAKLTKGEKRTAASTKRVQQDVAAQLAAAAKRDPITAKPETGDVLNGDGSKFIQQDAPAIPTTGYQGPMRALRDRVKAGAYTKAANGQPSCGDAIAQALGHLEPAEVIRACIIAMNLAANPYVHLNIGQQSMNLRNKLRGMMKRGEFGQGVLAEAIEVVLESRPADPKTAPAQVIPAPAPAPTSKAKRPHGGASST